MKKFTQKYLKNEILRSISTFCWFSFSLRISIDPNPPDFSDVTFLFSISFVYRQFSLENYISRESLKSKLSFLYISSVEILARKRVILEKVTSSPALALRISFRGCRRPPFSTEARAICFRRSGTSCFASVSKSTF